MWKVGNVMVETPILKIEPKEERALTNKQQVDYWVISSEDDIIFET